MTNPDSNYSHSDLVMELSYLSWWFDKRQAQLWLFGTDKKRDRRTEKILRKLATRKRKGLTAVRYGNKLIYTKKKAPDLSTIHHGLFSSECLIRFLRSNMEGEAVPQKEFTGLGLIPDGTILYPNKSILMWEASTKSNTLFHRLIEGKVAAYERHMDTIKDKFGVQPGVVFILEVPRDMVREKIKRLKVEWPYWFCDYQTFCEQKIGDALTAPIYFRPDGRVEAIKK